MAEKNSFPAHDEKKKLRHALITTTINLPRNLEAYALDFAKHGHDASIIIAGDKKTPNLHEFAVELQGRTGIKVEYLDCKAQDTFLSLWPHYRTFLPWNCIQRRNVAILHAYHSGANKIYTVDDDNFWEGDDYISQHIPGPSFPVETQDKWFNTAFSDIFYHRGYSFKNRGRPQSLKSSSVKQHQSVVNAGLWRGDPDIDAVTRLSINPSVKREGLQTWSYLEIGTKGPFNSQNTRLDRKVIPAYTMITGVGRYDDIIASYIVKRIADHLGDYISFGPPIVRQERNQHDVFKDLGDEILGMQLIDDIVDWLYDFRLTGGDYLACAKELIPLFDEKIRRGNLTAQQIVFVKNIADSYDNWTRCF